MKLSKPEYRRHQEACKILTKDKLSYDEKIFVLENWHEGATNINSVAGAFFTPLDLAKDFAIEVSGKKIIDLCAGIGTLSFAVMHRTHEDIEITCVEINPSYVEVGKKILPEATWICASIFDDIGSGYDHAISNPPFGAIRTGKDENDGLGGFEFSALLKASKIAKAGTFVMPQMSTPFLYSGQTTYKQVMNPKVQRFIDKTGIEFQFNCGIDTSMFLNDWRGVTPLCEICCFDFNQTTFLHATDIESGLRTSIEVSKKELVGLPENEPERTNFIASIMDKKLKDNSCEQLSLF